MKFFDPERAQLNGSPCLIDSPGYIPGFYIHPEDESNIRITVWVNTDTSTYSAREVVLHIVQLPAFIEDYLADPEKVLREIFDWKKPEERKAMTLEDIGL